MMLNAIVNRFNFTGASTFGKNALNKLYKEKILFVHVPKCGGTSLSHAMRVRYALSYFRVSEEASSAAAIGLSSGAWMRYKRDLIAYNAHAGKHFLQGHIPVDNEFLDTHLKAYKRITLLRHPVDRVISHYFFDSRLRSMTPKQFLASRRGFVETHVLCHFFGGLDWDEPGDVMEAEANAIATLDRFDVVGVLEEPGAFHHALREQVGLRLTLPKRNVGTHKEGQTFPADVLAEIRAMCAADIRIYNRYTQVPEPGE